MNAVTPFTFSDAHTVRVIDVDGSPCFVAADVCDALGLGDTSKAVSRLDDDERGTNTVRTPSGDQQMLIINESGLYSLILTSRKPEAKKFKKWVTSEVLPSIRKTGRYQVQLHPKNEATKAERDLPPVSSLVCLIDGQALTSSVAVAAGWDLGHGVVRDAVDGILSRHSGDWTSLHLRQVELSTDMGFRRSTRERGYLMSRDGFVLTMACLAEAYLTHPRYREFMDRFSELEPGSQASIKSSFDLNSNAENGSGDQWFHLMAALGGEYGRALMVWHMLKLNALQVPVHLTMRDWEEALGGALRHSGVHRALGSLLKMGVVIRLSSEQGVLIDQGVLQRLLDDARKMANRILLEDGENSDLPPVRDVIVSLRSDNPQLWLDKASDREAVGRAMNSADDKPKLGHEPTEETPKWVHPPKKPGTSK